MADAPELDGVSLLARSLSERIAPLCPHVPRSELERLTSRLAWLELASSAEGDRGAPELAASVASVASGNQVAWLPGPAGVAIVLPAGAEQPRRLPSGTELKALALRHVGTARALSARGALLLRQARSALLDARQARPRPAELSDR